MRCGSADADGRPFRAFHMKIVQTQVAIRRDGRTICTVFDVNQKSTLRFSKQGSLFREV